MDWVPLNDLGRGLASQRDELITALEEVLDSGYLVMGPQHRAFESELADFVGAPWAIGVASGTDALEIGMRAAMPAGRHGVVTTANAGGYSTVAARRSGYEVRYADVEPGTLCLDVEHLATVLDETVGVVVVTHLYGRAARVDAVRELCAPLGIAVLEDCAQAIGARTSEGVVGSLGDVATFSFYPTKNLGAIGDGGAVTTGSEAIADGARSLRQYGWAGKYTIARDGGGNSRLDELQAAFLRRRLPRVDVLNARRREILAAYRAAADGAVDVLPADGVHHAAHLAVALVDDRTAFVQHLAARMIRTDIHYPIPDHRQPAFRKDYAGIHLPVTERAAARVVSLPLFPELTDDEVGRVCDALAGR